MPQTNLASNIEFFLNQNIKDDDFIETIEALMEGGFKGLNCCPDILDLLDINVRPNIWFNLDSISHPIHFCETYDWMISHYIGLAPWITGFNIPITGRYIPNNLSKYSDNGVDIRAWLYYPMSEYSSQVADYINNLEEGGYTEIVIATKKSVDLADIIITVEKMRREVALPIKIYHPGAKIDNVLKYAKHVKDAGFILPCSILAD